MKSHRNAKSYQLNAKKLKKNLKKTKLKRDCKADDIRISVEERYS